MINRALSILVVFATASTVLAQVREPSGSAAGLGGATKVTINGEDTEINGKKIFGISVAVLPPPDGKTPDGKSAWQEFADAGVNLARIVPSVSGESYGWTDKGYELAKQYLDGLQQAHMYAWLWLGDDIAHF